MILMPLPRLVLAACVLSALAWPALAKDAAPDQPAKAPHSVQALWLTMTPAQRDPIIRSWLAQDPTTRSPFPVFRDGELEKFRKTGRTPRAEAAKDLIKN